MAISIMNTRSFLPFLAGYTSYDVKVRSINDVGIGNSSKPMLAATEKGSSFHLNMHLLLCVITKQMPWEHRLLYLYFPLVGYSVG